MQLSPIQSVNLFIVQVNDLFLFMHPVFCTVRKALFRFEIAKKSVAISHRQQRLLPWQISVDLLLCSFVDPWQLCDSGSASPKHCLRTSQFHGRYGNSRLQEHILVTCHTLCHRQPITGRFTDRYGCGQLVLSVTVMTAGQKDKLISEVLTSC